MLTFDLRSGLSPHNVHMNVSSAQAGEIVVSDVQLGGFDPAYLLDNDPDPPGPHGWEAWSSPETQVEPNVSKASDMFSLGLLVSPRRPSLLPQNHVTTKHDT